MIALMFVCILFFILGTLFVILSIYFENKSPLIASMMFFISFGIFIEKLNSYNNIKPIDVYRGKTTLRITYEDGIPTDTVVIFKNN